MELESVLFRSIAESLLKLDSFVERIAKCKWDIESMEVRGCHGAKGVMPSDSLTIQRPLPTPACLHSILAWCAIRAAGCRGRSICAMRPQLAFSVLTFSVLACSVLALTAGLESAALSVLP